MPTFDPNNQSLFINAADVKALYPSVNRSLIEDSLTDALNLEVKFNDQAKTIIVKLVMFCLNNTIIQYEEKFYKQSSGIVTGDNHSVSIASIAMHYVILPISDTLNEAVIFKRFIDDIIWLSIGQNKT